MPLTIYTVLGLPAAAGVCGCLLLPKGGRYQPSAASAGVVSLEPGRSIFVLAPTLAAWYGCTSRRRSVAREARVPAREVATRYREVSAGEHLADCLWASRNQIYLQQISNSKKTRWCALLHTGGYFFCKQVLCKNVCFQASGKETEKRGSVKTFG